ncbi:hypothetical protein GCM10008937_34080 [Deinococcus depolymerans]|uniref:Uncharacterized protein n=1 Tax=Deinococcus depolymerans TaxID=392408 RepID=A0ABN1CQE9_9DEIO
MHLEGQTLVLTPQDLVVRAQHLLRPLTILVQEVCCDQTAAACIRAMNRALLKSQATVECKKRYWRRDEQRAQNAERRAQATSDPMQGLLLVDRQVGGLHLQGVSVDGQEWRVNGTRGSFEALAQHAPVTVLVDLLLAARPFLQNSGGLFKAICTAWPEVGTDARFAPYACTDTRIPFDEAHPDFTWVRDALRAQLARAKPIEKAHMRPLHNRARHVR